MRVKAWAGISSRAIRFKEGDPPLLFRTDWLVQKQQELRSRRGEARVRETRRDDYGFQNEPAYGSCCFTAPQRIGLDAMALVSDRERRAYCPGSIPWCDLTLAIIVVDRRGQDGFHESAANRRPRQ